MDPALMDPTAQIIIAVGTACASIIGALAALIGTLVSLHNGRKLTEVRTATNGMKDQLVAEVRQSAHAQGKLDGKLEAVQALQPELLKS